MQMVIKNRLTIDQSLKFPGIQIPDGQDFAAPRQASGPLGYGKRHLLHFGNGKRNTVLDSE